MWIRSQSLAVLVKANEICIKNKTSLLRMWNGIKSV